MPSFSPTSRLRRIFEKLDLVGIMQAIRTFRLGVVGESFRNDDGTSRQTILSVADPLMPVELRAEPENPHDDEAVSVHITGLGQVGYLPRDHGLFEDVNAGFVDARIASITGGTADKPSRGIVLEIRILGEAAPQDESDPFLEATKPEAAAIAPKPKQAGLGRPVSSNRLIIVAFAIFAALVAVFGWILQRIPAPAPQRTAAVSAAVLPTPGIPPIPGPDTPTGRRPLSREEIIELQQGLIRAGFAVGAADGVVGPRT